MNRKNNLDKNLDEKQFNTNLENNDNNNDNEDWIDFTDTESQDSELNIDNINYKKLAFRVTCNPNEMYVSKIVKKNTDSKKYKSDIEAYTFKKKTNKSSVGINQFYKTINEDAKMNIGGFDKNGYKRIKVSKCNELDGSDVIKDYMINSVEDYKKSYASLRSVSFDKTINNKDKHDKKQDKGLDKGQDEDKHQTQNQDQQVREKKQIIKKNLDKDNKKDREGKLMEPSDYFDCFEETKGINNVENYEKDDRIEFIYDSGYYNEKVDQIFTKNAAEKLNNSSQQSNENLFESCYDFENDLDVDLSENNAGRYGIYALSTLVVMSSVFFAKNV